MTDQHGTALRRLELMLFLSKTYFTIHTTSPFRMLGQHLISTYDMLIAVGADADIATAGALHSVYGTDKFRKISIPDNAENRRLIQARFGYRTERLAYLFHACNRRKPSNIEIGLLFDRRCGVAIPAVSVEDIQALRLIEAANMLDQDEEETVMQTMPVIYQVWISQVNLKAHRRALALPASPSRCLCFSSCCYCCCCSCIPSNNANNQRRSTSSTSSSSSMLSSLCCGNCCSGGGGGGNRRRGCISSLCSPASIAESPTSSSSSSAAASSLLCLPTSPGLQLAVFVPGRRTPTEMWLTLKTLEDSHNMYYRFSELLQQSRDLGFGTGPSETLGGSEMSPLSGPSTTRKETVLDAEREPFILGDSWDGMERGSNNMEASGGNGTLGRNEVRGSSSEEPLGDHTNPRDIRRARSYYSPHIVFVLRGEAGFGMPWTPLWMLNRFLTRACGRRRLPCAWAWSFCGVDAALSSALAIEIKFLEATTCWDGCLQPLPAAPTPPPQPLCTVQKSLLPPSAASGLTPAFPTLTSGAAHHYALVAPSNRLLSSLNRGLMFYAGRGMRPPSIPAAAYSSASDQERSFAAQNTLSALKHFGYAIISVDEPSTNVIQQAFDALLYFHETVPVDEKRQFFRHFDGERYVGWARDPAREWLQLRPRDGGRESDGDIPIKWPPSAAPEDCRAMMRAVNLLAECAEDIFVEIGSVLELGTRACLQRMCRSQVLNRPSGRPWQGAAQWDVTQERENVLPSPGSSVCRLFVYLDTAQDRLAGGGGGNKNNVHGLIRDDIPRPAELRSGPSINHSPSSAFASMPVPNEPAPFASYSMNQSSASGAHADMGLLTLSPASTLPALHLLHPDTGVTLHPEEGLGKNEWVLFAGETLAFLTGGALQAPIHSVPHINRHKLVQRDTFAGELLAPLPPLRRSMPLFLRAVPDVMLHPLTFEQAAAKLEQMPKIEFGPSLAPITRQPMAQEERIGTGVANGSGAGNDGVLANGNSLISNGCVTGNGDPSGGGRGSSGGGDGSGGGNVNANRGRGAPPAPAVKISPRAMTNREFMLNHAIGIRPWRLGSNGDF